MSNGFSTESGTRAVMPLLLMLGAVHLLCDALQSLVAATYPLLKPELGLSYLQIGLIALLFQLSASLLQPLYGLWCDRHPGSAGLAPGMVFTGVGLVLLALTQRYECVLAAVVLFGAGSAIIHPEASRLTHYAARGHCGLAQSVFQVGGNIGGALGPLYIAAAVATCGRAALLGMLPSALLGLAAALAVRRSAARLELLPERQTAPQRGPYARGITAALVGLLLLLMLSKYIYMESLRSFYTFYLMNVFGVSLTASQLALFLFLVATAVGTMVGGPLGDRIGRHHIIRLSLLGTAPFALALPYAHSLGLTLLLVTCSGLLLSSAFPAIVVYAQELFPGRLGLISGLFFGFAFGMAGVISAALGHAIDLYGLSAVYRLTSYTPLLGALALLLPRLPRQQQSSAPCGTEPCR